MVIANGAITQVQQCDICDEEDDHPGGKFYWRDTEWLN